MKIKVFEITEVHLLPLDVMWLTTEAYEAYVLTPHKGMYILLFLP